MTVRKALTRKAFAKKLAKSEGSPVATSLEEVFHLVELSKDKRK
jgi:hypothetical protein